MRKINIDIKGVIEGTDDQGKLIQRQTSVAQIMLEVLGSGRAKNLDDFRNRMNVMDKIEDCKNDVLYLEDAEWNIFFEEFEQSTPSMKMRSIRQIFKEIERANKEKTSAKK